MPSGGKTKTHNRLWLARKRRGLRQKQVAYLLNHRTIDQISRYEQGLHVPILETALLLELIYGIPVRVLFKDLYEQLQTELQERVKHNQPLSSILGPALTNEAGRQEYCRYTELLNQPSPSPVELKRIHDHVTYLAKKLAFR